MVPNSATRDDLKEKAEKILKEAMTSKEDVIILMMHPPSGDQISDLQEQAELSGSRSVLLGGHLGLMLQLNKAAVKLGLNTFEAKSERVSEETIQEDGSVVKTSKFVYAGLRPLA
jgi:hypothetical protein